jgi:hypothetical protein
VFVKRVPVDQARAEGNALLEKVGLGDKLDPEEPEKRTHARLPAAGDSRDVGHAPRCRADRAESRLSGRQRGIRIDRFHVPDQPAADSGLAAPIFRISRLQSGTAVRPARGERMAKSIIYARGIRPRIAEALKDTPVVLVNGPRQAGKTTLIRQYASDRRPYLTLDDSATLQTARDDPQGFIQRLDTVVIDEVQRVPELLLAIKLPVDRDRRPGRFLMTGSADVMALPRVADSLAGRIEVLSLLPLAGSELAGTPGRWPDAVFGALAQDAAMPAVPQSKASKNTGGALERRVLQGGYPEALQRDNARRRNAWARGYIDAVLKRDVRDIAAVDKLDQMPRLLFALAQMAGQLCNYTQLGGQLGLDAKTVTRYVTMLEQLFLVRRVPAWSGKALSRVLKTPKIQFLDSGLLCSLLKLDEAGIARNRGAFGHALECYVYGELTRQCSWADDTYEVMMYRDRDLVEVDFVMENAAHQVVGVEVKAAASIQNADFSGLKKLAALAGKRFLGGVVLYDGINTLPMGKLDGKPLWAVPLATLSLT